MTDDKLQTALEAQQTKRSALIKRLEELEGERRAAIESRRNVFRALAAEAGIADDFDAMLQDVSSLHNSAHRAAAGIRSEIATIDAVIKAISEMDTKPPRPRLVNGGKRASKRKS